MRCTESAGRINMSLLLSSIKTTELKSEELALLVRRVRNLVRDSYDQINQNADTLCALYKRIMQLARQEKEWYLYFNAIYEFLYINTRKDDYREIVKYAEIYYRDSALYMDRELPNYPGTDMRLTNILIYNLIFKAYLEFYQIDDTKMEAFMRQYELAVQKYGRQYNFYNDELDLALLYRDVNRAKNAAHHFLEQEKEIKSCYVCAHVNYLNYLLLTDQERQAEELMLDLIHKNIPLKHQWCYQYCEIAEPANLYSRVLTACIKYGKMEAFRYFYEKYWQKLPRESKGEQGGSVSVMPRLFYAYAGFFDRLEGDLRAVEESVENEKNYTTVDNVVCAVGWWLYFLLLDKSGVHEVTIRIPGLEADGDGKVSSLEISAYMEKKADEYGGKFSQARAKFDYHFLKESYRKCLLEER